MTEETLRDGVVGLNESREKFHELPIGSELLIAFAVGISGWYVLARFIAWLAG